MVTVGHVIPTMETALASEFTFQYVMADEGVTVSGVKLFAGFENTHNSSDTFGEDVCLY